MSLKPAAIVAVALLVALLGLPALPVLAQNPCDAPNILFNCNFDAFASVGDSKQVPEGWWYFLEMGDPAFDQSPDTAFGAPALRIWSDGGSFAGGIYQVVPNVTPGARYQANIGWAAASVMNLGRQLGIDPTGGTDARSANVVWGPMCWDKTRMPALAVSAVAAGATITVFVRVQHDMSYGADQVFLDAVSLMLDAEQPAAPALAPTATPAPPTATRRPTSATPILASVAPSATVTATPTFTPTSSPSPTVTDTATPTVTPSPTASMTATPSRTPTATHTPRPTPTATTAPFLGIGPATWGNMFLGVGMLGFVGVVATSGLLWWMSRSRGRRKDDEDGA